MTIALLEEKLAELEYVGVAPDIISAFRKHIETAEVPGLQNISAFRMADTWGMPRLEVLEAFLYGTRMGIFDLSWDIRCPSCKGITAHAAHLNLLKPHSHCDYCEIDIQANFDDEVEVTFQVNDNIRQVTPVPWYELAKHWHLVEPIATVSIPQDGEAVTEIDVEPGTYYIGGAVLQVDYAPTADDQKRANPILSIICNEQQCHRSDKQLYHSGTVQIALTNQAKRDIEVMVVHRKEYPWTSAAQIASTQSFRDLFSSELISADETFAIRSLVIVFTDIKGSTALYERLGDSDAYYLVKEHFRILTEAVKEHGGAVVKTIGDAVMATFMVSTSAIRALFEMQLAFAAFNAQENIQDDVIIKVGAHRGACIAVTSNDRLDYFGHTVNIAARVQGLSTGEDIMLTQTLYEEPEVRALVDYSGWQQRHFTAPLRGIRHNYKLVHLTPPEKG